MHYYPRRLGDYSTATTHLSMLEHGAYTKLLDYYYSTEKPLPADRCERIAGAYETHEREAVRSVLQQFFTLTDSGWVNAKADEVISDFRAKSLKAKESAGKRWKRTESDGNANACANAMLTQNSKPITQKKEQKQKIGSPNGSRLPADWFLPRSWGEWAERERPDLDVRREADSFRDYWHGVAGAKARKADWEATWRNWIRKADGMRRRAEQRAEPSKRMQGLMRLEELKNGGLGTAGNHHGDAATLMLGARSGAGFRLGGGNGSGMGGGGET